MSEGKRRTPLNGQRVLRAAVALADEAGLEAVSMRNLAQSLDVVPMALYKHVANKEELLDGMIGVIVGEIEPAAADTNWKTAIRQRILSAREALLRHPWASRVFETRTQPTPVVLDYINSLIGMFRAGGFSVDLTHMVMHALGSRMWGFTQELFPTSASGGTEPPSEARQAMAARYPFIIEIATVGAHQEPGKIVGTGCDDQLEFEFALDLMLDGFDRLRQRERV